MGFISTMVKAGNICDARSREFGFFTTDDLKEGGVTGRALSVVCFFLKRSDLHFFYLYKGQVVESKYDVSKEERPNLTLCFTSEEYYAY